MKAKKGKVLVFATILSTLVYLIWRTFCTLPAGHGTVAMVLGIILLLAEVTGMFEQIVHFYNMKDREKPKLPEVDAKAYPSVDVFIATYNEPVELLYKTVNGCVNMEYPNKDKVKVYLCDDGNREEVRALADKFKVGYFARKDHKGAKAGNLNHALSKTDGELIVTFDADMIPMSDFLMATVPYFFAEEKVGFIQTPQSFYNLDLFQFNLYSEHTIPNEQDYFYRDIQIAKNKSNSVIYGGSNTVIARKALDEVGGFVTNVITEDFATGLLIQSKGYTCYAIDEVHASGLSPEDLTNLIKQRKRWARGCIQTGRKLSIVFRKGLSLSQKISYLSSISYWYSSIKRLIYMLSPIIYSVFGITVLVASPLSLCVFWLPMYVLNSKTLKWASGNIRTTRWTNIYETIMFPLLLKDVLFEMAGISEKKFSVTRKGSREQNTSYIKYAIPHIILAVFTGIGIFHCFLIVFITGNLSILFLVFWLLINFYNLLMAIFFMLGRKNHREYERFAIKAPITIAYKQREFSAVTNDISEGGVSILMKYPEYMPPEEEAFVTIEADGYKTSLFAKIVQVTRVEEGYRYAFQFQSMEEEQYRQLLWLLHDRVPPLTTKIHSEFGFFEDLRINLVGRYQELKYYNRKLPRVSFERSMLTTRGSLVTMVSFNYEYAVLKVNRGEENKQMEVEFRDGKNICLEYVRNLAYYHIPPGEIGHKTVGLYRVKNLSALLEEEEFAARLYRAQTVYETMQEQKREKERKAQVRFEYNEMEWL